MANTNEYLGFPFISNINEYVQRELNTRSKDRIRGITPYIKVTPGFTVDGTVDSKIVLKGIESLAFTNPSEYTFTELYRPQLYFRPLPAVKSVSVDYLNQFGSVKKAVISWVCHTLEDLERLSPYFLNPGQTVFIEWGWSNKAIQAIENDPKINLRNYLCYVKRKRLETNGNYDGMLGIIVNYSFSLNRDGGFDCTTEVVSAGYLMEGLTLPNQYTKDLSGNEFNNKNPENQESQEEKVFKPLKYFLENDFYAQIKNHLGNPNFGNLDSDYFLLKDDSLGKGTQYLDNDKNRTNKTEDVEVSTGDGSKELEITVRAAVYASWGYLEDYVINPHISIQLSDDNLLFKFDSSGVKISSHPYLRTTDLSVFILPQPNNNTDLIPSNYFNSGSEENGFGYVRRLLINVEYFKEVFLNSTTLNDAVIQLFSGINDACINYWNFRISPQESSECDENLQENNNLNKNELNTTTTNEAFVSENYQGLTQTYTAPADKTYVNINKNNKLQQDVTPSAVINKKSIVKQKIVDINYSGTKNAELDIIRQNVYAFRTKTFNEEPYGKDLNSVVRNVSLQSKLSSQAAMNVFFSAHSANGGVMGTPSNNTFKSLYNFSINGIEYDKARDTFSLGPYLAVNTGLPTPEPEENESKLTPGIDDELELLAQSQAYGKKLSNFLPIKNSGYTCEVTGMYFIENTGKSTYEKKETEETKINISLPTVFGPDIPMSFTKKEEKTKTVKVNKDSRVYLTGIEGMRMAVLCSPDGGPPQNASEALVPLECEIELEGISGIRIGDVFTIDHIPQIYQNHGLFQVIGITDSIDNNSWITKLKAQFRVFRTAINYAKIKKSKIRRPEQDVNIINYSLPVPDSIKDKILTEDDYINAANELNIELAVIKAVAEVESSGIGFLSDGSPKILFEAHIFSRLTGRRYDKTNRNISSPRWNKSLYVGGFGEHKRLKLAMSLDKEAALQSASWGKFQILGINYKISGWNSINSFVDDMYKHENQHLKAFIGFVKSKKLVEYLRKKDWNSFAYYYNGPKYKENHYDLKLQRAYEKYKFQEK